jgi:hypothetical protein
MRSRAIARARGTGIGTDFFLALALLAGCGSVAPEPATDAGTDAPVVVESGAQDAPAEAADGACWRCADRAWRNVCVVPSEVATDAESCLHCGEHCNSTPDASGE